MRWLTMLAIAAAMFALVYFLNGQLRITSPSAAEENARPSATAQQIFAAGVVAGEYEEIVLKFELPGRIRRVLVDSGTQVKAGQVLAELDSTARDLQLQEARAHWELARAERELVLAGEHPTATRWRAVAAPTPVAPTQVSAEELKVADARIRIAEAAVNYQRMLLSQTRLMAPVDGEIVHCDLSAGNLVGPTDVPDRIILAPRGRAIVRAFVEELDALDVQIGQQATVLVPARRDRRYQGVVTFCAPELRPKLLHHNLPGERLDIRVREVTIMLEETVPLLRGLPVEVFIAETLNNSSSASKTRSAHPPRGGIREWN
jgi:multidrug efflux pump subunit AcrA (membrane-fusion protein)